MIKKKKYFMFFKEISAAEALEGLLGYGLFSENLPPIFTSKNFFDVLNKEGYFSNGRTLNALMSRRNNYIRYESLRNINIPRQLAIPNPIAYGKLTHTISSRWKNITDYFERKTKNHKFKISRVHIRKINNTKRLFRMNYDNFFIDGDPETDLKVGKKFFVKTDISNCFSSIYSHSISWAIKGKYRSKIERGSWSDDLDEDVRRTKFGETDGLLIGPHAYNLISEIILVSVDNELYKKGYEFVRYIDDYKFYAKSLEEAESFLLELSTELKKYNLVINLKKTQITELPLASDTDWKSTLTSHYFYFDNEEIGLSGIKSFWNLIISLFRQNENDSAILNYAIKVTSQKHLNKYARDFYIKTIFHLTLLFPYLVRLLDDYVFEPFSLTQIEIKDFLKKLFYLGQEKRLSEALSYSVYLAGKYGLDIYGTDLFSVAKNNCDTVLLTLAYMYDKKFEKPLTNYQILAQKLGKIDIDLHWLFIYEVLPKSKLKNAFAYLKDKGVTFINWGQFNEQP